MVLHLQYGVALLGTDVLEACPVRCPLIILSGHVHQQTQHWLAGWLCVRVSGRATVRTGGPCSTDGGAEYTAGCNR